MAGEEFDATAAAAGTSRRESLTSLAVGSISAGFISAGFISTGSGVLLTRWRVKKV
jgi:hypothetical protein